jgi:hypothetical protein
MALFFVPLQLEDIILLRSNLKTQFAETPMACMGIEVCEKALALGARDISFFGLTSAIISDLSYSHLSATCLARSFDAQHSELRARHLGLEMHTPGWDYLNVFFIADTVLALKCTARSFVEKMPSAGSPVLFTRQNAQDMYFDSGLIRGLFIRAARERYPDLKTIDLDPPSAYREKANRFELTIPKGTFRVLSHLPTVFYSANQHIQRLNEKDTESLVDLESPYFDIPMSKTRVTLAPARSEGERGMPTDYLKALENLTRDFYATLGVSAEAEACGMLKRHEGWAVSQYLALQSLKNAPSLKDVERVEVSCHDTGLAGPLLSWANSRDIAVEMWPHSEVINIPTPVLKKGRKHSFFPRPTLPLELGVGSSLWVDPKTRQFRTPKGKQNLLILMNQMDTAGGVPRCRVLDLQKGLNSLVARLRPLGWQVKLRQKPSHPYSVLMGLNSVEQADGPLENWLEWPEVCLSIVGPTTAMTGFWKNGVRCYHLQEHTLAPAEEFLLPAQGVETYHSAPYPSLFERLWEALSENILSST